MHEQHPGVQDMACDTFLKIAQKCKRKFVTQQQSEDRPFVCELVDTLKDIISDLAPHQVQAFYEAVGCILSDKANIVQQSINRRDLLIKLMDLPNRSWKNLMEAAKVNVESLMEPNTIKEIIKILRSNNRVCSTVGPLFSVQLEFFFLDMLNVYKVYSEKISQAIAEQGPIATKHALIRSMRLAKKEVLKLLSTFIEKSDEPECGPANVASGFIPHVLDPILDDYKRNIPGARDPEVLTLFSTVVTKLRDHVVAEVPRIMSSTFECTLQMITVNFEDFPEHRIRFFEFLKSVNLHAFPALFQIPTEHQKLVVDSIVWAFKHTERNISETGLDILHELLRNVANTPAIAQGFYQSFLLALIQDVLGVMTDRLHKSGFKMHATLLQLMFHLVQNQQVTVPLNGDGQQQSNPDFLRAHISNLLITSFTNLTRSQVSAFVDGLFNVNLDILTFKVHLRDFLISLKEFSVEDNQGLFQEEQDERLRQQNEQLAGQRSAVPGMLKPSEIDDEDL